MHETTLRGIGTVVTLVRGRQRMGPIKEMNFRTHTRTHTLTLTHLFTPIQHQKSRHTSKKFCFMKSSYVLLYGDIVLTCLSAHTIQPCLLKNSVHMLHNDRHTDTQSLSVISNWHNWPPMVFSPLLSYYCKNFLIAIVHQGTSRTFCQNEWEPSLHPQLFHCWAVVGKNDLALWGMRGQGNLGQNPLKGVFVSLAEMCFEVQGKRKSCGSQGPYCMSVPIFFFLLNVVPQGRKYTFYSLF